MGQWDYYRQEYGAATGFNDAGTKYIRWGLKGGFVWRAHLRFEEFFGDSGFQIVHEDRWHTAQPFILLGAIPFEMAKRAFRAWVQAHDEEMLARLQKPRNGRRSCEASALFAAGRNE